MAEIEPARTSRRNSIGTPAAAGSAPLLENVALRRSQGMP